MKVTELREKIQAEISKAKQESQDAEGLVRLQEAMQAYSGEDKLVWSDELLEEIKKRPVTKGYEMGMDKLDALIGGFRPQQLVTISGHSKHGKCLAKGTEVLMFNGTLKKVEDILVGDRVMGPDSKPRKVLALGNGTEEMYRIKQNGSDYTVNKSHILSLKRTGTDKIVNINIEDYLLKSKTFKGLYKGWKTGVDFPKKEVLVDPYFLGVWLGDGTTKSVSITNIEKEIEDYLSLYALKLGLSYRKKINKNRTPTLTITRIGGGGGTTLQGKLNKLGVLGNKHIPESYKINDRETRLKLLAGIIDTDGSLANNRGKWQWFDIIQKSNTLSNDIVFLARSLGFAVSIHKEKKSIKKLGFVGEYNRIRISGDLTQIPVIVERKKSNYKSKKRVLLSRIKVEPVGLGEYFGFELDGDGLFVLSDFTVTHNTGWAMFSMEKLEETNPVMIPLEQSNEELIMQRYENGQSIPRFLSPRKLASRVTLDWIEERIIEGIAKYNTKLVVIDHLGYIDSDSEHRENLAYRLEMTMKGLKNLAKKWNVAILVLVHISQHDESYPPTLQDLKGSSSILQESDLVMMLWRKNRLESKIRMYDDKTMVSVLANRRTGKIGNVGLRFEPSTGRYHVEHEWVENLIDEAKRNDFDDF